MAAVARSAARPYAPRRRAETGAPGSGPRSPEAESRTAGRPAPPIGPCSESVAGSARRIHCATAPAAPGARPVSRRTAASTVRSRPSGAGAPVCAHGTTTGRRTARLAMSPSTSTPSTGPVAAAWSAHPRAPAYPVLAPDVETSTSVLPRSRARTARASSSSAAVADSSASASLPALAGASRWASTTTRWLESPGRTPTTVSRSLASRPPPGVRRRVTAKTGRRVPGSRALSACATRSASPRSPAEPGCRSGNARASSCSELRCAEAPPKARCVLKLSEASGDPTGAGRSASEKAATNSATSAGRKAAR